ncbi:Queuine tRNA-ribosyltransferase, containing PUA domain [Halanaeroarchaeum sp. HSR-CO]|uniref:archaeosine synthase subunit alpha n=1 Tax=Halanaeroarchaeum sp. HSR-CO TaxID=2866382 RepID=UPI00217D243C|nr:archaeosine synthase subunit alpha [Halanaeroarchaeum sp. HSR-CO]UWG48859.1 Queuine tRNA-ribosyltransferase, containing PUA domain [Halanaeroarchaeum sp. HSR-CO]
MTEYFEVLERDAAARLGELRLEDPHPTPGLADDVIEDAGSEWVAERALPEGDESVVTVLPNRAMPSGTPERVQDAFATEYPDVDFPSAAVVSPRTATNVGADVYVLSGAPGIVGHGSGFVDAIVETKRAIPDDSALSLPGVATPANVATLVYAGVDLVDETKAVVEGTRGRYLTTEGDYALADLEELPCSCSACSVGIEEFDREACVEHNRNVLAGELGRVRQRVRDGRLRDYIEGQARHVAWLTAAVRELDDQWTYQETRTPVYRDRLLLSASEDTLRRVEIQRFANRVTSRFERRLTDVPLLLVPCSAKKPYSESQSHRQFQQAARYRAHVVSMTSPIGVVPQELELTYPAQHYDSVVTGRWSADEIEMVADILRAYLDSTDYPRIVAHVPEHGYRAIVERATADLDIPVEFTVEDHPTTDVSLANLGDALEGERTIRVQERERATLAAVADYHLGEGAAAQLFEDVTMRGRYPKLQAIAPDGEQLAALVPKYGSIALTLDGARRWAESPIPTKTVQIDDFVPHGSVLAPGVVAADDSIREGDEVVVEGPSAFGIGRAAVHGRAMAEATRGVAVDVRHVTER